MGQRYNKNAKTVDCGFQKVVLEMLEVKLWKKNRLPTAFLSVNALAACDIEVRFR